MNYCYDFLFFCSEDRTNIRTQSKFIVFLSQLLLLKFCPVCKADNPLLESRAVGTMAEIKIMCGNEKCPKRETAWRSQPFMPDSKVAAGNFLLCYSTLVSGGSASKTFRIFQNMGLWCISLKTFFKHQKVRYD